jgi:pentatricopeptide repeat protein
MISTEFNPCLSFLVQCHEVDQAERIFSTVKEKTVFMYGALFKGRRSRVDGYSQQLLLTVGYVFNEMPEKVLQMFNTMPVQPDEVIATILFNACAKVADPRAVKLGKMMLTQPPATFFDNSILMNSATDMLMKFGEVQKAEDLFSRMKKRDAASYGVMMNGYNLNGLPEKALELFDPASSMLKANLYTIMYSTCATLSNDKAITSGKHLLDKMPKTLNENLIVMGSAIHMLMKFGEVAEAERLFSLIKKPDAGSYGVMMNGYNLNGLPEKALDLFDQVSSMLNAKLYTVMYSTCATLSNDRAIRLGKQLLHKMPKTFSDESIVMGSAIHMLMKFGDVQEAERHFYQIKQPNAASYAVMMNGYNLNGLPEKALDLFDQVSSMLNAKLYTVMYSTCAASSDDRAIRLGKQLLSSMPKLCENDSIVMGSAIHMLMKFGEVAEAERLFCQMKKPDAASYGVMMNGYNLNGLPEKALDLFDQVSSMLNSNLYTIMYSTCATLSNDRAIRLGKQFLHKMSKMFSDDLMVMGSAIHMLMKFGDVPEAERLFSKIKQPNAASYGVMMNGYNLNGLPEKALDLFDQASCMLNAKLYTIMYSTCAASSDDRAITFGKQLLHKMAKVFEDDSIVMGSAIHMLMKFGDVQEAERLFYQIKQPNAASYGVMMNGYNINSEPRKCLKLFEEAKRQKIKLDERIYVSLVGAYSRIGMISMCQEVVKRISIESLNSPRVQNSLIDMWVSVLHTADVGST